MSLGRGGVRTVRRRSPDQKRERSGDAAACVCRRDVVVLIAAVAAHPLCAAASCLAHDTPLTPAALQRGHHAFDSLAASALRLPPHERLSFVNDHVNQQVEPQPDEPGHDHWATPFETLARGAGDCEDVAIAKFFLLRASGVPLAELRLVYAWHQRPETPARRRAHMVAVARHPFQDPWVLDTINLLVVPMSLRDDLVPVFSFDEQWLWPRIDGRPLPPQRSALLPWRGLLTRWDSQLH